MLLTNMVEFNHLLLLLHRGMFSQFCGTILHRLVQLLMNKASQRFLKDMVEFNHPLFLLYHSIFHNSALQVARGSSVLRLHVGSQI